MPQLAPLQSSPKSFSKVVSFHQGWDSSHPVGTIRLGFPCHWHKQRNIYFVRQLMREGLSHTPLEEPVDNSYWPALALRLWKEFLFFTAFFLPCSFICTLEKAMTPSMSYVQEYGLCKKVPQQFFCHTEKQNTAVHRIISSKSEDCCPNIQIWSSNASPPCIILAHRIPCWLYWLEGNRVTAQWGLELITDVLRDCFP